MGSCTAWGLAAVLACIPPAAAASLDIQAPTPKAANASRTPEKRAEKQPKPRKSKKVPRSGGAASAPP